ncbi:RIP metalloprotease RseP [Thermoanaerobacteraceae bacterium SP2]|nr:RIP metalloprotease RseP [Thermoanaerobacteraceae bacterium SP2]
MYTIIASVIVFGMLIFFHEFGHFILAKLSDIKVREFSLGFGPQLFKMKPGETEYSIRVLPLGGFVKMEGEDTKTADPRAFNNKPIISRLGVIFAGPAMNFVLAVLLIAIISFFAGVATTKISVIPGEPADKAGLKNGDVVYSIDGQKVRTWDEVVNLISQKPCQNVSIVVLRDGKAMDFNLKTEIEYGTQRGIIGIKSNVVKYSVTESIKSGVQRTFWISKMILVGLFQIIRGKTRPDVVGPIGIVHMVGEAARVGIFNLLYLSAIISINLGLFNLLPIPALDGSRIFFLIVEFLRGKPLEPEKEGFIHFIGFTLLMILMIIIAYKDIMRFIFF